MSNEPILTSLPPSASTTDQPVTTQPPILPEIKPNIFTVLNNAFLFLISRFFLLSFGIFIGVGVVVKFSPETKNLKAQIKKLTEENDKLKNSINKNATNSNWGDIKNSIILKN